MDGDLGHALKQSSELMESALADAREELAALDTRRAELTALIERAEAVQRSHNATERRIKMTLHDAMALVLDEHDNRWMNIRDLGNEVNQRDLYRKRDGSEVEINQFHARINNYSQIFERNGPDVRLRSTTSGRRR